MKYEVAVINTLAVALAVVGLSCKKVPVGHPPAAPSEPMGISNGGYNSPYEFSATATDPDTDSIAIRFSWGDGATSDWSDWVASGETARMSHAWSDANKYQVKAQAKDRPGSTSDWSEPLSVDIIATHPPNTPGAPTGPPTAHRDSLCTFTTIAIDPDGDGIGYRFDWGTGDTSAWTDWVPSGQPISMKYAFYRGGTHQVRAQARDVNEVLSLWSNALSVAVPNPHPPDEPSIPTGPDLEVVGGACSFGSAANDPDGDSVSIHFAWGNGDTSVWGNLVGSGDTVTQSHVWSDTGTYYVEAQARDEDGATSDWSEGFCVHVWRPKWRYLTGDYVYSSPAIGSDGTIYVGSYDHYLYAVNPDGALKWRYPTGDGIYSPPAIGSDGTVYVGSFDSYLYAIGPDGTLKWRYQVGSVGPSSPAVGSDGTVYVGSYDYYLYAINPDGALKWRYQTGSTVCSSPAIGADGTIYVGSDDHYLHAVSPDGALKWRYPTGDGVFSSPAIGSDGTVYVGSFDNYLYAINPDGTLKWRYRTGDWVDPSPTITADGTVYVGSRDHYLYAIDFGGTLKWRYRTDGYVVSSSAIGADGTIYVGSLDDYLYAINPDGTLRRRYPIETCSSPAIGADGTIYVGSADNYLYAIQGDSPLADAPWPKFHHDNRNTGRVGGP